MRVDTELSPEDQRGFAELIRIWKPMWYPPVMVRWWITEWCNYDCPYCGQQHGRCADRGNGLNAHAFDNFAVELWSEAFARHFWSKRLSLTVTGGEPFLDRSAIIPMLNFLSALPNIECIRVDTNACWRPEAYRELNRSKLILNCSFHPTEIDDQQFVRNLGRVIDSGFRVGMVTYVMTPDRFAQFEHYRRVFSQLGVPLNPNPNLSRLVDYTPSEQEVLKAHLPDVDYRYKVLRVSPKGRKCFYPAIGYRLDYRGVIRLSCVGGEAISFFGDNLPPLPIGPVPCPQARCECLDMYSFLKGITRNKTTDPLGDYCEELKVL